jgi:hypothetical protein
MSHPEIGESTSSGYGVAGGVRAQLALSAAGTINRAGSACAAVESCEDGAQKKASLEVVSGNLSVLCRGFSRRLESD